MVYKKKLMGFLIVISACAGVRGASLSEGAMGAGVVAWDLCAGWSALSFGLYSITETGRQEYSRGTLEGRKSLKICTARFGLANVVVGTNRLIHGNKRGAAIAYTEAAVMGFACGRMIAWDRNLKSTGKKPT